MNIRSLHSSDKPAMRALVEAVHTQQGLLAQFYWPPDLLGAELATAEAVGVFEGEALAGFILYRELPDAWEISLVASHPRFRRQGYMERLFTYVIAAKGQERQLWLEVHEENLSAQKLYEKLGFKEVRRRPRYYADSGTAILYTLE
ncbi:MAG: peptide N-acetyltransferase [Bdellovibrio sp. ArHS]|uniref:GNAT family N-acetyltransferase n=1 Tax=Bdellovibrio sp. ArHS TaxID=1569284 RepID=UPI0005826BD3|nr:GNAT family N-acetyltransferase [Bdellovibrio sp. ArHS]KHD87780.1 MAG: peptide N-acetyltransferase [Bdellovibrio sp. ArHS]